MTTFSISIVSDTICPWCYIGYRKLQVAQRLWNQSHPNDTFTVRWFPYQLRPESPIRQSRPKQEAYSEMLGPERTAKVFSHLTKVGEPLGINFRFGGNVGNTRDSHRLVHLAGKLGGEELEHKTVQGLFTAYFEQERDITDLGTLKAIAVQAGIAEADFEKSIVRSDEGGADVDKAVRNAQFNHVSGVPDFTVQEKYNISGAQDPEVFINIFQKIKAQEG